MVALQTPGTGHCAEVHSLFLTKLHEIYFKMPQVTKAIVCVVKISNTNNHQAFYDRLLKAGFIRKARCKVKLESLMRKNQPRLTCPSLRIACPHKQIAYKNHYLGNVNDTHRSKVFNDIPIITLFTEISLLCWRLSSLIHNVLHE